MKQHALRTAVTLYRGGTLDLETAASQAGVDPAWLERDAERLGDVASSVADRERVSVRAD